MSSSIKIERFLPSGWGDISDGDVLIKNSSGGVSGGEIGEDSSTGDWSSIEISASSNPTYIIPAGVWNVYLPPAEPVQLQMLVHLGGGDVWVRMDPARIGITQSQAIQVISAGEDSTTPGSIRINVTSGTSTIWLQQLWLV